MTNDISGTTKDSMAVRVSSRTITLYSMGAFGTQFFNGIQSAATFWFWQSSGRIDPVSYTLIMLIFYNIWNAVNDPVFGWISDRTKTRWGRRIPYIRFFTPIWFITMIFLFFPFLGFDKLGMAIWLTVFILIFDGCYTMVAGCYNSLMPELSTLTTERTRINTRTQIFALMGQAVSFVIPILLLQEAGNPADEMKLFIFIIIGGILALLALFIPSFFLRERKIAPDIKPLGLIHAVKSSVKNKPFMAFVGWNFMSQFATSIVFLSAIDYASHALSIGADWQKYLIFGGMFLALLPGFLINRNMGKIKGIRYTVILNTCLVASGLFLLFLTEIVWMAVISLAITGFGLSGMMLYGYVMVAEAVDYDELQTHQRREAMFFGTNALFTKPAIGIAHSVATWTLALAISTSLAWRMIIGLYPSIALFISLIFVYFFPKREEITEMKKQLSKLHAE